MKPFSHSDFSAPRLYLDSAARHPLPASASERLLAYARYLEKHSERQGLKDKQKEICGLFSTLINADIHEIVLTPSTTVAEMIVLSALGLPHSERGLVTDNLHYAGSLARYQAYANAGAAVAILSHRDGSCYDYAELEKALKSDVRLVALSSVSHFNGARHDLKKVCELAHANGALVYADIIQEAGVLPIDVRSSGVDFCACSSYKWLLGDMGCGFLYVREEHWPLLFGGENGARRSFTIQRQSLNGEGNESFLGSFGASGIEVLIDTLPRTISFMSSRPEVRWAQFADCICKHFGDALNFRSITPPSSPGPIRAFLDPRITPKVIEGIGQSGVTVTAREGYLRLSPALFNTTDEIQEAAERIARVLIDAAVL